MSEDRLTLADKVHRYLTEQGGSVESDTGRGITARMAEVVGADLGVLNGVLARMERNGLLVREVRGRRTYRIALDQRVTSGGRPASALPRLSNAPNRPGLGRHRPPPAPRPGASSAPATASAGVDVDADPEVVWLRHELIDHADKISDLEQTVDELIRRLNELENPQPEHASRFLRRRVKYSS